MLELNLWNAMLIHSSHPGFHLRILLCSQSGERSQNNLAKFGYTLDMEVGGKKILLFSWLSTGTYHKNLAIWKKNSPNPPPSSSHFEAFQLDEAPVPTWGGFFCIFLGVSWPLGLPALMWPRYLPTSDPSDLIPPPPTEPPPTYLPTNWPTSYPKPGNLPPSYSHTPWFAEVVHHLLRCNTIASLWSSHIAPSSSSHIAPLSSLHIVKLSSST